ncbi:MAG: sigma-70 family RNA polymerase sigma factor [Acidimicrobiales bacterium]|nr:sigma-70 family RNA polymerase sigma factor [Acidimicrobiales bacterium]
MTTTVREPIRPRRQGGKPVGAFAAPAAPDVDLVARTRDGDSDAYAALYARHAGAARRLARHLTRTDAAADDVVADAFTAVLASLRAGGGPTEAFRPYLLTTVRRRAWRGARDREEPVDPADATGPLDDGREAASGSVGEDEDAALLVSAYRSLPERWQLVLWHTEVEGRPPAEVAPLVGLSPHATAALSHRAREGLREAFLQAHLQAAPPTACRPTIEHLGALVRGSIGARDGARARAHLEDCPRCCELRAELTSINTALRAAIGPLVLGGAAAAYLARQSGATTAGARSAVAASVRRGAALGAIVALSLGVLAIWTERRQPSATEAAAPTGPAAAGAPRADDPADPSGPGSTSIALPGGTAVTSLRRAACADDLGVAVTTAAPAGESGAITGAVLVRAGGDALTALGVTLDGVVTPVTGTAGDLLRDVVAPATGGRPAAPTTQGDAVCVRLPRAALLDDGGAWALVVTYLPPGGIGLDDVRVAALSAPFALLGDTTRDAVRQVRSTLADALDGLAAATGAAPLGGVVDGAGDAVDGVLDGAGTLGADPLAGGGGGTGGAGNAPTAPTPPAPTPPTTLLPPLGLPPTVTLPPVTLPTLPSLPPILP